MANEPRFLLGKGERLVQRVAYHGGGVESDPVYPWSERRIVLGKQLRQQQKYFDALPEDACPNNCVTSVLRLHPQHYSRSAFPSELLRAVDLRFLGSKPARVKPQAGRGAESATGAPSTDVIVLGKRTAFAQLEELLPKLTEDDKLADDLLKLEQIRPLEERERLQSKLPKNTSALELVMHFDPEVDGVWEESFRRYAESCNVELDDAFEFQSRGLWFLPARATAANAEQLAKFAFVRAIRPMPKLRIVEAPHVIRSATPKHSSIVLPADPVLDPELRIAVFDGGLPQDHLFGPWIKSIEPAPADRIGDALPDLQAHGAAVTSALLFGHVQGGRLPRPYGRVDHYRVLGDQTLDRQLYAVLLYVDKILSSTSIDMANFSFGPDEIIGDDQVTAWTTMLDDHFHDRSVLASIAVGNNGELPEPHNRIQVPSDCVNAIAVGAADSRGGDWKRASYSCVGPGRAPGVIKPELVAFGGGADEEFQFLFPGALQAGTGTSYAAPLLLRTAAGVRAHFGRDINNLAIRALLIHTADSNGHDRREVGWGRAFVEPSAIMLCDDASVRILYQGILDPAKVVRAVIPLPKTELTGFVTIRGTFCYVCRTDPNSPGDYTRSGLDVVFRPHVDKLPKPSKPGKAVDPNYPATKTFFQGVGRQSEQQLRADAFKWDTVRHAEHRFRASTLKRPVFDIHYVARSPGSDVAQKAERLNYALVVTVSAPHHDDLYDRVLRAHPVLEAVQPRVDLPVRIDIDV